MLYLKKLLVESYFYFIFFCNNMNNMGGELNLQLKIDSTIYISIGLYSF